MIRETTFTAIDFESAGTASGRTDAPVQIGTTTWSPMSGVTDTWTSYIHTNQPITWSAHKVHGITKEDLRHAPKLMLLWPDIKSRLANRAVVAHGHGTEKRFLRSFPGHNFGPWIDTLLLSRAAWPELPSHSLGDICHSLQLTESVSNLVANRQWHDALYDAAASVIILAHLIDTFSLENHPLSTLLSPDTSAWNKLHR